MYNKIHLSKPLPVGYKAQYVHFYAIYSFILFNFNFFYIKVNREKCT